MNPLSAWLNARKQWAVWAVTLNPDGTERWLRWANCWTWTGAARLAARQDLLLPFDWEARAKHAFRPGPADAHIPAQARRG